MTSKHYKEQKMLIENFRKWQAEDLHEEINNQEQLDEIGVGDEISAIWSMIQSIAQLLTIPTAAFYTMGPWLKLILHHPKVQAALSGEDKEKTKSAIIFRAMAVGLKGADNAAQWFQDWANNILAEANEKGKKKGFIHQMANGILLYIFLATFWVGTGLGTIFSTMALRGVPALIKLVSKSILLVKKSAMHYRSIVQGEPTPDEEAEAEEAQRKELEELQNLEKEMQIVQENAMTAVEVLKLAQQDPEGFIKMYNISMSAEDLKHMGLDPEKDPATDLTDQDLELIRRASKPSIGYRVARGLKAKAKDQE